MNTAFTLAALCVLVIVLCLAYVLLWPNKKRFGTRLASLLSVVLLVTGLLGYAQAATPAMGQPAGLHLTAYPTHLRASWSAVTAANGYRVSLIRQRDNAVMRQLITNDTVTDIQPVFPGESYTVAVQALDSSDNPGIAAMSPVIKADASATSGLNGFYDGEDVAAGGVNPNKWDVQVLHDKGSGGAFVNDQLHYHIVANSPTDDQSITTMRARVPINTQSNRTAHIHGEVDLKSDMTQWFGLALSPHPLGADEPADMVDRPAPATMPVLELFDAFDGKLHLLQGYGNGSDTQDLGAITNPTNINNVRDAVDLYVNQNHVKVLINGSVAFDTSLPHALDMPDQAWLTLFAEDYPGSGGGDRYTACDHPGQPCNIWHLDSWGFDAPSWVSEPAVAVSYADGCGPAAAPDMAKNYYPGINNCDTIDLRSGDSATTPRSTNITVASVGTIQNAALFLRATWVKDQSSLKARVNGGSWMTPEYITTRNWHDETYRFPLAAGTLRTGANTVEFLGDGWNSPTVSDIHIDAITTAAFVTPPLPPQPTPVTYWGKATASTTTTKIGLAITNFSPSHGKPGTTIRINGLGFTGATAVQFGGNDSTSTLMVHSDNEIMVNAPSGAKSGTLTVVTPKGNITSKGSFMVDGAMPLSQPASLRALSSQSFWQMAQKAGIVILATAVGLAAAWVAANTQRFNQFVRSASRGIAPRNIGLNTKSVMARLLRRPLIKP